MPKVATQPGYTPAKRREDYRGLFSSDRGKRVLNDLANVHFLYAPTEAPNEGISDKEFYIREGRRRVIVDILITMRAEIGEVEEKYSGFMQQFMTEKVDGGS